MENVFGDVFGSTASFVDDDIKNQTNSTSAEEFGKCMLKLIKCSGCKKLFKKNKHLKKKNRILKKKMKCLKKENELLKRECESKKDKELKESRASADVKETKSVQREERSFGDRMKDVFLKVLPSLLNMMAKIVATAIIGRGAMQFGKQRGMLAV